MRFVNGRGLAILFLVLAGFHSAVSAQGTRGRIAADSCKSNSNLNGVYRIDVDGSDKLYSVIEEATSNVPFADQQQFFIDLAVRLTPPDLLAIECHQNRVSLASSRAPRTEFTADGTTRTARSSGGQLVRSRIAFDRNSLVFNSTGSTDNVSFTFTPLENGSRLRVSRRISSKELIEPVVINTVYDKISEVAQWDIFSNDSQFARQAKEIENTRKTNTTNPRPRAASGENNEAELLRASLSEWINATNSRDIEKQMSFYMPQLKAFYLTRNAPRSAVRQEKNRAFASAKSIDIRAAEPEIIFQDAGQTAVMRFRKTYEIRNAGRNNSGVVIQELRWQRQNGNWKIFSERDIKVLK